MLKKRMSRPHNNPSDYPPTPREFDEDVRKFRRRQLRGREVRSSRRTHKVAGLRRRFEYGGNSSPVRANRIRALCTTLRNPEVGGSNPPLATR